jgi:hypothetical protein
VLDSTRVSDARAKVFEGSVAKEVVASFFDSSLFDEVVIRLLESRQLWLLVEEIAHSPSVTAAVTQQGFGFADQVSEQLRTRSCNADNWLERVAARLSRQHLGDSSSRGGELRPEGAR